MRAMVEKVLTHTYDNGLTLLAEPMRSLESAAFTILVPAGSAHDPADRLGLSNFVCEMALRGAGERDGRQFVNDLDVLGVERGESVSDSHTCYSGATVADNLPAALTLYADLLRRAHLPAEKLEAGRQVVLQELRSVEDEPAHKLMQELRRMSFPPPYGRPPQGELPGVQAATIDEIRDGYRRLYRPNGAILGVAGAVRWEALKDLVGELLGDWPQAPEAALEILPADGAPRHFPYQANQTQIGVSYPSVPYRHPEYYRASASVGVLSSGMSARLFTEVREKRGLCYSVFASYYSTRDHGGVLCYAGTSADRAQETLDVTVAELRRLAEGIEEDELQRLKARVKSSLIMQQESSAARTAAIVRDWYHLGRVRTLEEVSAIIDGLTREQINDYLRANPPREFTVATLGPSPLEVLAEPTSPRAGG